MSTYSVKHLFPQLLMNGYVPLPNRDKACMLPKWPTITVDEAQCLKWTRQTRWPAIGLRVVAPLLVLDFDIPDPDVCAAAVDYVPKRVRKGALERVGSPPKTAFFLRLHDDDPLFYCLYSSRYLLKGTTSPGYRIEAYGAGGGGKQFGAFGPHSHDDHGKVLKTYSWVGERSPATVPISKLPVMRGSEVSELVDSVDRMLAGNKKLVRDKHARGDGEKYRHVYDLTDDMIFTDTEGFEYTLEELTKEAKALKELKHAKLRITGSFTNDPLSSGSARCVVHWSSRGGEKGSVVITDYKEGKTHYPFVTEASDKVHQLFNQLFPV